MSQELRTFPLPGTHVLVGYLWQNTRLCPVSPSCHNRFKCNFVSQPAQIPACGTTAPGSSEILASARPPPLAFCYSLHLCLPCFPGPSCPDKVSSVGCVSLSVPSPCCFHYARDRPYRLRVLWTDPTPEGLRLPYLSFRCRPTCFFGRNSSGLPSSRLFSPRMPRSMVDPGRPSGTSPFRFLCAGFWFVDTIAICSTVFPLLTINEAISSLQLLRFTCGLRGSLCTLQLFRSICDLLHNCNTRYGLVVSLCPAGTFTLQEKKRRTFLGAPTIFSAAGRICY